MRAAMNILNVAAYKFTELDGLPALRSELRQQALDAGLKGTILIAPGP